MWIAIGIIFGIYVIYKAIGGSAWAIILLILALVGLSVMYWHYLSFILAVLGICLLVISAAVQLSNRIRQSKMEEVNALVAKQEKALQLKSDVNQMCDNGQSVGASNSMITRGTSNAIGSDDTVFSECLVEMQHIENELLPVIDEMSEKISESYESIAQTVSRLSSIVADYSDGHLSEKGKWQIRIGGSLLAVGIGAIGEWKAKMEKEKQLEKLLIKKKAVAQAHLGQVQKLSPKLKKYREKMKLLVEKGVVGVKYEMYRLMDGSYANQVKDNAGKILALYRQTLYYDMLVDYLTAEYKAWLAGYHDSAVEQVSMYDVNVLIAQDVYNSDDRLKTSFMRLLELDKHTTEKLSGGDIMLLSDPQLAALAIMNNGGKYFKKELVASNVIVSNYLADNPTYVDFEERFRSYHKIADKKPIFQWWVWLGSLLSIAFVIYQLFGSIIKEQWQMITCVVAFVLVFAVIAYFDLMDQKDVYRKNTEKLEDINIKILHGVVGFVKKRKKEDTPPK